MESHQASLLLNKVKKGRDDQEHYKAVIKKATFSLDGAILMILRGRQFFLA